MAQSSIKVLQFEDEPCIDIKGEFEQGTLDSLIKAFQKTVPKSRARLFLRLSDLAYLDSSALGLIMYNMNELAKQGAKLVLLDPSAEMRRILRATSLDRILEIR
ncbi:MAG TPA: STAS domain-containing protein, partial [Fibrobacteria bacterium]|nr:STAS domain-containing protein [Fibrobacteria bacterium]